MSALNRICLYCGSNPGGRLVYHEGAAQLGRQIAESGATLVYGGGNVGLMGIAADAALKAGGRVIGVIPESLIDREVAHLEVTELKVVQTMHERKALMESLSDAFIAMPGGFGTLDELFEIITWAQLGFHSKPIGLLNLSGYFDSLLKFIDQSVEDGFVRETHRSLLSVETDVARLLQLLAKRLG